MKELLDMLNTIIKIMEYFIIYGIGFLLGCLCTASAEMMIEKVKLTKKKKNEKTF
jgi:hypothetical protein